MKRIILAALMMLTAGVSASALAEWVRVSGNDRVTAYADPGTLRKRGNIVKITSLFDFKEENTFADGSPYISVLRESEFNCKDNVQHMISYAIYSGNMARGHVVDKGGEPQDWKTVSPSNMALAMRDYACKRE
jgi:hypothetical protein